MSTRGPKDDKTPRNLPVAARCLALVFSQTSKDKDADLANDSCAPQSGEDLLDDFKLRNKTCYWNPALVESVKLLEYLGFVQPWTVFVGAGDPVHLENIRTAWGRRALKPPLHFTIQNIGEVSGIEMQVIPQTQFIPLPEALCLIIMELNNSQVVATLDTIREKLQHGYKEISLPSDQLIYDTLAHLIRERKVFHTGSGYFVVTPDTYRMSRNDPNAPFNAWVTNQPMYIPVMPPPNPALIHAEMKSISCQTSIIDEKVKKSKCKPLRTQSMRAQKSKSKEKTDLKRSASLRYQGDQSSKLSSKDVNLKNSNINQDKNKGEKMSLLAKLFGRQKKKATAPSPSKDLEYTTFSAQFPPPEWNWYQQQQDKHHRTERWVTDQMVKSRTWHHMPQRPGVAATGQGKTDQAAGGLLRQRSATLAVTGSHHFPLVKLPPGPRDTWRLEADGNSETPARDSKQLHNMETRMETNDRPRHKSPPSSFLAEDAGNIPYPVYPVQSTPIMSNSPHISRPPKDCPSKHPYQNNRSDNPVLSANSYNNFSKKAYKAKKKLQKLREHHTDYYGNDISVEYKGKMCKNKILGYSRDSGVNCIGQAPLKAAPEATGQSVAKQRVPTENVPNDFAMPEDRLHNGYGAPLGKSNSLRQRPQHKHSGHKYQRHSNIYENIPATIVNNNPEPAILEHNTENKTDEKNYPDIIQRAPSIGSDSQGGKSSVRDSSEKSFNTVIAVKALVHSGPMEHLVKETKDLNLGDSGFSSPRFAEGSGVVNANFMKSREKCVIQNHLKISNKENIDGEHANNKNLWSQSHDPAIQNNGQLESPLNNQNYCSNSKQKAHPELIYQGSQNDLQGQGQKEAYNGRKFDFNADYEVVGVV